MTVTLPGSFEKKNGVVGTKYDQVMSFIQEIPLCPQTVLIY